MESKPVVLMNSCIEFVVKAGTTTYTYPYLDEFSRRKANKAALGVKPNSMWKWLKGAKFSKEISDV